MDLNLVQAWMFSDFPFVTAQVLLITAMDFKILNLDEKTTQDHSRNSGDEHVIRYFY